MRPHLHRPAPGPLAPAGPPPRWPRPGVRPVLLLAVVAVILAHGYAGGAKLEPATLIDGAGRFADFADRAFPPDLSRLRPILAALVVTFEMALLGTLIGVAASIPLAVAAARNTSPHPFLYGLARGLIGLCRTIPDLVWGLIFVVTVGLGPEAGVLAIAADVMGFCGRFFAEAVEEVDAGITEALRSTGAGRTGVVLAGILPACLPSFVATTMFALESSTRSSVVLGVVGAGGIGIELTVAMQLLRYDEALTIILAIFAVVLGVERVSTAFRRHLI